MSVSRILMTADAIGGVWTYALELARALAPYDVEIALATMGREVSPAAREELDELRHVTLLESSAKLEWMDQPWDDVDRAGDWLLELAAEFEPDIIHLNGYCHAALPWDVPVLVAAHSCVLSWWAAVRREEAPAPYDEYRRRVRAGLAAADQVVAPTAAMLKALEVHYGPNMSGEVIPNGRARAQFVAARKEPRILAAGRIWDEAKNIGALDRAAPSVRWPIHVAGNDEHPNGSRASLRHAQALGKLSSEEMAAQLSISSIYALPACYEPFGLSALEAGLCGCALVLGDIPSLREVWGDAALFVAPHDDNTLAETLNALIDDENLRLQMGCRARARALEYSPEAMARGYLGAYRSCRENLSMEAAA
jgi:glycosyltransferase involved in cell wall biosynthesis